MANILNKRASENKLHNVLLPDPHRELRLKEALRKTLEVLEETRKAFKSKRLEVLRKKLNDLLIESK